MKSILIALLLSTPLVAQENVRTYTGLPICLNQDCYQVFNLHVDGSPVEVNQFIVEIYPMNTPPPWPVGLWIYTYVESDRGQAGERDAKDNWGQSQWCGNWFRYAADWESTNNSTPYVYIQINQSLDVGDIQTDEGIDVHPPGAVTCWAAWNGYKP